MLCLSGFELYSRWVPLRTGYLCRQAKSLVKLFKTLWRYASNKAERLWWTIILFVELLSFMRYKPIHVNISRRKIERDLSSGNIYKLELQMHRHTDWCFKGRIDPDLPGPNKYSGALICLCLTNTANTLGYKFACVPTNTVLCFCLTNTLGH